MYASERSQVQLAFILQILRYGAGRPGATVFSLTALGDKLFPLFFHAS